MNHESWRKILLFLIIPITLGIFYIALEPSLAANPIESNSAIPDFKFQVPIGELTQITSQELKEGRGIQVFIKAIYQWTLGFAMLLAVLTLTYAGLVWMTARGGKEQVTKAKEIIRNTLIGLVLAIGSYVILAAVNPKLLILPTLTLGKVTNIDLPVIIEPWSTAKYSQQIDICTKTKDQAESICKKCDQDNGAGAGKIELCNATKQLYKCTCTNQKGLTCQDQYATASLIEPTNGQCGGGKILIGARRHQKTDGSYYYCFQCGSAELLTVEKGINCGKIGQKACTYNKPGSSIKLCQQGEQIGIGTEYYCSAKSTGSPCEIREWPNVAQAYIAGFFDTYCSTNFDHCGPNQNLCCTPESGRWTTADTLSHTQKGKCIPK